MLYVCCVSEEHRGIKYVYITSMVRSENEHGNNFSAADRTEAKERSTLKLETHSKYYSEII